jgi:hypothetical protein
MNQPVAVNIEELEKAYQAPNPGLAGSQQAEAVVVGSEGITVLCSTNPAGEGEYSSLIRLTNDGVIQWRRNYTFAEGTGRAITHASSGFAIAGDMRSGATEFQGLLLTTNTDGDVLAKRVLGPRGSTGFVSIATLADGSIVAGGTASWKGWKVHADAGLQVDLDLSLDWVDDVSGVASLPAGGFAMAARMDSSTTALGLTRLSTFAADQSLLWEAQLPAIGRGELTAITIVSDGTLAGVGHYTTGEDDAAQLWVVRVDAAGVVVWERLLGAAGEEQRGRAITSIPDEAIVVASDGVREGRRKARVIWFSADGEAIREHTYGAERMLNFARGIAHIEGGGLVLVGSTVPAMGKSGTWILGLDSNGQRIWEHVIDRVG